MDALNLQMKLTPQLWTWDGARPGAGWLAKFPSDVPVLWQARLTDDPAIQSYLTSLLPAEERARLVRLRLRDDQHRFLTGRGLLRIFIGAQLNLPPERVELGYGPFGKPYVIPQTGAPTLHFNVSHSGKLVLLAFHPAHEVGVDVEAVRRDSDWEDVARHVFSEGEYRRWALLNSEERPTAFFRAWTRHEAILKALGRGIADDSNAAQDAQFACFDLELPEGYHGAAACLR